MVAPLPAVEAGEGGVVLQERPSLGGVAGHVLEATGHDAHHREGPVVQADLAAHDRAVRPEPAPPQPVAEHHDVRTTHAVGVGVEATPQRGRHAQRPEVVGAHPLALQPLRLALSGHGGLPWTENREGLEGTGARRHLHVRAEGDGQGRAVGRMVGDRDEPLLLRIGERPEEHGAHGAEDRRRGSDAQAQRRYGHHGEAGAPPETARSVAHVRYQGLREAFPAVGAHVLAHGRGVPVGEPDRAPGLLGRQAPCDQVGLRLIEIVPHLVRDVLLLGVTAQEGTQAAPDTAPGTHGYPSAPSRRPTAATLRRQSVVSASSLRTPARVSE